MSVVCHGYCRDKIVKIDSLDGKGKGRLLWRMVDKIDSLDGKGRLLSGKTR